MYNISAIKILKAFSNDEIKEFDKFVRSPFFGGSEYIYNFFKLIKKFYPEFDSKSLEKTKVFNKLYPGKKYDDAVLRKLSSELLKLLEKYMTYKGTKFYPSLESKFLLTFAREKRLDSLFISKWKDVEENFNKRQPFNFDALVFQHLYQIEIINHNTTTGLNHLNAPEYIKFGEYILNYSLIILSQVIANNSINNDSYNTGIPDNLLNDFLDNFEFEKYITILKEKHSSEYPVVELNYFLMMMYKDQASDEYFNNYKRVLYNNLPELNNFLRFNLFCFLINNANYKVQLGRTEYCGELLSIFDKMVAENLIVDPYKKYLGNNHIRIAAIAASELNKFEWLDTFVKDNLHLVDPASKKSILSFVNALAAFEKGEFEKALEFLNDVEMELIAFKFDIKELMLKIYYELDYLETALSAIDAFKSFINKNKFSSEIRKTNLSGFVKHYNKLLKIKMKSSYDDIGLLKKEIEKGYFAGKIWMVNKVLQLEKTA